jgi:uncharacterized membrane protein
MNFENLILTDDICTHYHVEHRFIHALSESGIIQLEIVERKEYLPVKHISEFEKMRRLYYEMDINLEGLEAIQSLLEKVQRLQRDKQELKNRLRLYE